MCFLIVPAEYAGVLPPPSNIQLYSFGIKLVTFQGPIKYE